MTVTLPEFVLARIADDDAGAFEQHTMSCAIHQLQHCDCGVPAGIRRWCDVGRRLVALHGPVGWGTYPNGCNGCGRAGNMDDVIVEDLEDCPVLQLLAFPSIDHDDYDETWRPPSP